MSAVHERAAMIAAMAPSLNEGAYGFACVAAVPAGVDPLMTFIEREGMTIVADADALRAAGAPTESAFAWITLTVHSSLEGVGLTAAVSGALADAGIACNVVAAAFHDHLFVPVDRAGEAMAVLERLRSSVPAPPFPK